MTMKLLLVEDDANVAAVLAETFREQGHQTTIMHTGEAALSHLEGERPDAVILDIKLPNINGIEVLRAIRVKESTLPVIIISGRATPQQLEEARRLGVTEVIGKPEILKNFTAALARASQNRSRG
jgi:two-component system response regulator (stage 0 sporulation protein F)